jgi:hypothetical protein
MVNEFAVYLERFQFRMVSIYTVEIDVTVVLKTFTHYRPIRLRWALSELGEVSADHTETLPARA